MKKTHSSIMLGLLFTCSLWWSFNVKSADAASTLLYISPSTKYVTLGTSFTVDICVSDVEFLYDWQANITFNPSVLRCVDVTEGDFLARQPEGTWGYVTIEASWAIFGWTTLGAYIGESGSGTLATVEFEVLARGESLIEFAQIGHSTYLEAQTSPNPPPNFDYIEFTAQDGLALTMTTLCMSPATTYAPPGSTFAIDIEVIDVELLYDYQVNLTFNSAVLSCIGVTEGDFLAGQPAGTLWSTTIETSWVILACTTIGDYLGVSGSGTLATVEFEYLDAVETPIEFASPTYLEAQTSPNPPLNFENIVFTALDGLVIPTAPATSISLSGVEGQNGWFTSDVTVTLSVWGVDIDRTEYSLDNETWHTYVAPFKITEEGHVTIYYRSIDTWGNTESAKIQTAKIDKTPPTGLITINDYATHTTTTTVTLALSADDATSGLAEMRCSNDNVTYTEWEPYVLSKPWALQEEDGVRTVYVQFSDNSGLVSSIFLDTIVLDTEPPTGHVGINAGTLITNTPSVTLSLTAFDDTSGVLQSRFSHDNITWTSWEAYQSTKTWTLTAGDGVKAVHVQFRDNAGLISEVCVDTITLDATPPNVLITSPGIGVEIKSTTVRAIWSASDVTSALSSCLVKLDSNSWINVGLNMSHTFASVADGIHTVEVKVTDMAGLSNQDSVEFIVNTSSTTSRSYTTEAAIVAIVILAALGTAVYILRSRK